MKLTPAPNILFAFGAGLMSTILLHYARNWGYVPDDDIASALPGAIALALAHGYDMITGDNKPGN